MEARKWEDLQTDCLVEVFERVGLESLVLDIPFVCKSWFNASLHPQCWQTLDFTMLDDVYGGGRIAPSIFIKKYIDQFGIKSFSVTKFIMFVLRRSCKSATDITFSHHKWDLEILDIISEECPALKNLKSPDIIGNPGREGDSIEKANCFAEFVRKFKFLEFLKLSRMICPLDRILEQISLNCKNFTSFTTIGIITADEALAIATFLPNIKSLDLSGCDISHANLTTILRGCKQIQAVVISFVDGHA